MWYVLVIIAVIGNNLQQPTLAAPFGGYKSRADIAKYIFVEIINVLEDTLYETAELMQSVVDDAQAMNYHSAILDDINEFLEATKKYKDDDHEELEVLIFDILEMIPDNLDEDEAFDGFLRQHGLNDLDNKMLKKLSITMNRVEVYLGEYIHGLSDWRRMVEHDLLTWFDAFKNEKNIEKKIELFFDFIDQILIN